MADTPDLTAAMAAERDRLRGIGDPTERYTATTELAVRYRDEVDALLSGAAEPDPAPVDA